LREFVLYFPQNLAQCLRPAESQNNARNPCEIENSIKNEKTARRYGGKRLNKSTQM